MGPDPCMCYLVSWPSLFIYRILVSTSTILYIFSSSAASSPSSFSSSPSSARHRGGLVLSGREEQHTKVDESWIRKNMMIGWQMHWETEAQKSGSFASDNELCLKFAKTSLLTTSTLVNKSLSNFAQSMAVWLLCSVHNFRRIANWEKSYGRTRMENVPVCSMNK